MAKTPPISPSVLASLPRMFATFSALSASIAHGDFSVPCDVSVINDETNGGERTKYFWNGAAVVWVPTVEV